MNREMLNAYHDGELTPDEAALFEERLAREPALRAELKALRDVDAALDVLPAVEAPADLADRVRKRARRRGRVLRIVAPLAAAAAALAIVLPLLGGTESAPEGPDVVFGVEELGTDYRWEADEEIYRSLDLEDMESAVLKELGAA